VKTENLQCDNNKPFSSGGLLACNVSCFNKHKTACRILNFILRAKDVYLLLQTVPFTQKVASSLGGLQPKWPLVLRSLPSPPCILEIGAFGKSSQHYIIKIVMALIMRMPFILVFQQSKCISAIMRILFYYFYVYIFEFIHVSVCSLSLWCMLIPRALRVEVKTLYTINQSKTFESSFIHHDFAQKTAFANGDIKPFCRPLICQSSVVK